MPYDFKKEMRELYNPKARPAIVTVPPANFVALRGQGDPNEEGGAYQQAIAVLYAVAYTLKMSGKSGYKIGGFFDFVVPPLEGFWWQEGAAQPDYTQKGRFCWISALRLPDFVTEEELAWAKAAASQKKKMDCTPAAFTTIDEGLCVQMLHQGPYSGEPDTLAQMDAYITGNGYASDLGGARLHHEIYLSGPRSAPPEKWRTVLRIPIRRLG